MSRKLTGKQSEFASAVAQGTPLAQAYRVAYRPKNPMAPSVYPNSRRALKHPGIAARIKELQLELLPAPEDMRAIYQHGLATILQLSISAEDGRVRLRAAEWLCSEAEKRQRLEADRPVNQSDEIFDDLRGLYQKALTAQEPPLEPLVEEVSDEPAAQDAEGTLGGQGSESSGESASDVSWNPPAAEGVEEFRATTGSALAPYIMERVPGHFPPKFRRRLLRE
jgi:hypothetical protein